jgi:hypothetical protein
VFEQVAAWIKQTEGGPAGLSETETYREASKLLKGGVLNFFFHLPSIGEMAGETSAAGFRLRPLLQNVRMDAVHLIAGNVSLSGARTRTQIAVLGDTEPGTPFDIWTDGSGESAAGAFVDSNTISYQEGKIDLLGVFGLVKRALQSTAAAGQQGPMEPLPHARTLPPHESAPTGAAGPAAHLLREHLPRDATAEHKENPRQHRAVGKRLPSRVLAVARSPFGQEGFDSCP